MAPHPTRPFRVALLAGGFGGARMAHGFDQLGETVALTIIGNTADDVELHGLHISPDLDTIMYTLAGLANEQTGWGVTDETWSASEMLGRYGEPTWFRLGDRDLATHVVRSDRLARGARLTDVTRDLSTALGVRSEILPMTDQPVRTTVRTDDGWLDFQDYFVRRRHSDEVLEIRFGGIAAATATAEVTDALRAADVIVVAPSNPYVSVAPILATPGVLDALESRNPRAAVIAVSPIVGGAALRGPAAAMMRSLGGTPTAAGIAAHFADRYPGLVDVLFVDDADHAAGLEITKLGITPTFADIVIAELPKRVALARAILRAAGLSD